MEITEKFIPPRSSNKSMYLDDFVPADETDMDRNKELRAFIQEYFRSRNLINEILKGK